MVKISKKLVGLLTGAVLLLSACAPTSGGGWRGVAAVGGGIPQGSAANVVARHDAPMPAIPEGLDKYYSQGRGVGVLLGQGASVRRSPSRLDYDNPGGETIGDRNVQASGGR